MKNYRVQDGCASCKFRLIEDHFNALTSLSENTWELVCEKVPHPDGSTRHHPVERNGICDLHEKEAP